MTVAKAPRRWAAGPAERVRAPPPLRLQLRERIRNDDSHEMRACRALAGRGATGRGRRGRNRCSTDLFCPCARACQCGAARSSVFPSAADDVLRRVPCSDTDACARKYRLPGRHRSRSQAAVSGPEKWSWRRGTPRKRRSRELHAGWRVADYSLVFSRLTAPNHVHVCGGGRAGTPVNGSRWLRLTGGRPRFFSLTCRVDNWRPCHSLLHLVTFPYGCPRR